MNNTCTFFLCDGDSPSGDSFWWEIEGVVEGVEDPHRYDKDAIPTDQFLRVTVTPGQHLFLDENHEGAEWTRTLFRVPTDPVQFERFCEKAEAAAGQKIYDRILGYKRGPRSRGRRYDYTNDFGGEWLEEYVVSTWCWEENGLFPANLAEAIGFVTP